MKKLIIKLIRMYQYLISPMRAPCCRFYPSCSEYARQAVEKHGVYKGMLLIFKRIFRCHPLCIGGYDPVP